MILTLDAEPPADLVQDLTKLRDIDAVYAFSSH
jgi:hypothetical protein